MKELTSKKIGGWQRTVKKLSSKQVLRKRHDRFVRYRKALKKIANDLHQSRRIKPKTLDDEHYKQAMNYAYSHVAHALWTLDQAIIAIETLIPEMAKKKAPFYFEVRYEKQAELKEQGE